MDEKMYKEIDKELTTWMTKRPHVKKNTKKYQEWDQKRQELVKAMEGYEKETEKKEEPKERKLKYGPEIREKCIATVKEGKSVREVSKIFGPGRKAIVRWLKKAGVQWRRSKK